MRIPFLDDLRRTDGRTDHHDLPEVDDVVDVTAPILEEGENVLGHAERGRTARSPWNVPPLGWKDVGLRVKDEWGDDHVGMAAAAVAFYAFLALIPAMAALVSILGLIARNGDPQEVIDDLFGALPEQARDLMTDQLEAISASSSSSLSFGLAVGLVLSIWTASGAIGQLVNTINIAYDEEETRSWIRRKLIALGLTFGAIAFVAVAVFSVVALPSIIERTGLGIGTRRLLNVLIWPGLAIGFMVALAVVYRIGPDRRPARWRWVSVGSVFALVAWIAVTLGFRFYVSQFGSYNETYGSLAGVIVSLFWLWLTAVIVLLGAEINAELEHQTSHDTTIGGEQPMGQRGAVKADTLGELRE
jgi:membrane protein